MYCNNVKVLDSLLFSFADQLIVKIIEFFQISEVRDKISVFSVPSFSNQKMLNTVKIQEIVGFSPIMCKSVSLHVGFKVPLLLTPL